jgi:formyltetrahydrofolate deformylase
VETDFRARSAGHQTPGTGRRAGGRYADTGRPLITCPDRPGIAAAVPIFLFSRDANITESRQHSTDPFGGTFIFRIEFHLNALAECFANLASASGELAGRFPMRWKMTRAAGLIAHQNKTIVFT